jgi:hypothetical protein
LRFVPDLQSVARNGQPTVQYCMVTVHTTFSHNFLKATIETGIKHAKENGVEDDPLGNEHPFEIGRHTQSPQLILPTYRNRAQKK